MALNPLYVIGPPLQDYFVDKDSGLPLAGGKVYFYSDIDRGTAKTVYMLSGNPPNYSFVALPNPVILSGVGTFMDNNGNDIVVYYLPFDAKGNQELYYIVVQSALGVPQFTRQAWPNPDFIGPNPPALDETDFNYIPNGQFWCHMDLPSDTNTLLPGSNVIAQGGFTVELPDPVNSTNTIEFIPQPVELVPSESPRWLCQLNCTSPSALDDIKNFRVKFYDVNKFSGGAQGQIYTFGFYADSNVNIPISILVYKYFGTAGTVVPATVIATDVIIANAQNLYQYQFSFGSNAGYTVDTVANNDFVAIDIAFPLNIGFQVELTDFTLLFGVQNLTGFPIQTSADMISRGVAGWLENPAYDSTDLFLPVIATRYGLGFDISIIGKIESTLAPFQSPLTIDPLSTSIDMPCDGASYRMAEYSNNGVPFSRLGQFLINSYSGGYTPGIPLTGTGVDFATAYVTAAPNIIRLTVNKNGAGIAAAADVNTLFTIDGVVTYNLVGTGSASLGYSANVQDNGNGLFALGDFGLTVPLAVPDDTFAPSLNLTYNTPPLDPNTGLYAQQGASFSITPGAAALLVAGLGNEGQYFIFSNATTTYYVWFYFNGEIQPTTAPIGSLPIRINMDTSYNNIDVASIIRETINAYQISTVQVINPPAAGTWWTFSANPGASQNYYVWYTVDDLGTDPNIAGAIGIKVELLGSDINDVVASKTQLAIDQFQFAAPDLRGLFLRGNDPDSIWDLDAIYRTSNISGFSGPTVGTFEYGQLLSHFHVQGPNTLYNNVPLTGTASPGGTVDNNLENTANTGGTETRPVNYSVNYVIKY